MLSRPSMKTTTAPFQIHDMGSFMIRTTFRLTAFALMTLMIARADAERARAHYCYTPCKSKLSGYMQIKYVSLSDPDENFVAYVLNLNSPISVPSGAIYEAATNVTRIQLQFEHNISPPHAGACIVVNGELAGAETASDIYQVIMRVDAYNTCK